MSCPNRQELSDYLVGKLAPQALESIDLHVEHCHGCQAALATVGDEADPLIAQLRRPAEADPYSQEPACRSVAAWAKGLAGKSFSTDRAASDSRISRDVMPRQLGEYEFLERLGAGGMGTVYKARHARLGHVVAMKVLAKGRADPRTVARFERELKVLSRLRHSNIVAAQDTHDIEGTPVLVMEYVEGIDLGRLCARVAALRIADACELVRQAALGLQYTHEHGLVHRDMKPSNLMLTPEGQVKILDFGLALLRTGPLSEQELSLAGTVMGTLDFMAPEQTEDSHHVDIRADIYSLGCTLYRFLTGHAPFDGPGYSLPLQKMMAHEREAPVPAGQLRAGMPAGLAAVVEQMMAKLPADRPALPISVAQSLESFAVGADLRRLVREATGRH